MENLVLSLDVGIRNMAICVMSAEDKQDLKTYKIHLWNVFDTLDTEEHLCICLQKNGNVCNKKSGYKYSKENTDIFTCKSHFPKELLPLQKNNHYKKKMINDYLLQDIASVVLQKLQNIYNDNIDLFNNLNSIVIELQLGINAKMKFISHIIYGKFVELMFYKPLCTIRFIRASQKLKAYTGPEIICKLKGKYAQRKWLGIQHVKWFFENKFCEEEKDKWISSLDRSKSDDLSDCILYCIIHLHGIPKKQKMNFKKINL